MPAAPPAKHPRICAHRGLSEACPENTLPAFAAAIACGADELELDLWLSRDGVPVVCHDERVDRTCLGQGRIGELDWATLRQLDAGSRHSGAWRGVRLPRLEEVLELAGPRVGLNIHLKEAGPDGLLVRRVAEALRHRGMLDLGYIAGEAKVLDAAATYAPGVARACLHAQHLPDQLLAVARQYQCQRIQFNRHKVTLDLIHQARDAGMITNLFWSDEAADALAYARQGIEVILSNRAHHLIADGVAGALTP